MECLFIPFKSLESSESRLTYTQLLWDAQSENYKGGEPPCGAK